MKFLFVLLLVQAMILMANTKAHRNSSRSARKPVVDLTNKEITVKPKPPEERRKLPIFPKNTQKFVVTSKPYARVRTYTARPVFMTKKTVMPIYKPSITTKEPVTVRPSVRSLDSIIDWPAEVTESRMHRRIVEEKHVNNNEGYIITQGIEKDTQNVDDSEEISTGLPEFAEDELSKELDNSAQVDFNTLSELDPARIKRLAVQGPTVYDSWFFKNVARVPNINFQEVDDEDEFIFVDNKQKKTEIKSPTKSTPYRSVQSNFEATSQNSSRSKRNNNIIEEENPVTTVSGFESGCEPRLGNDLVFKNIHA